MIRAAIELDYEKGEFTGKDLAEKMNLTERAIRNYLKHLRDLGIIIYIGSGKFRINHDKYAAIVKKDPLNPTKLISVENFVDFTGNEWNTEVIRRKVQSVLQKINLDITIDEEYIEKIRNIKINETLRKKYGFRGDWLINKKYANSLMLDNIWFAGTVSRSSLRNFRVSNFAVISIVILTASVFVANYRGGMIDEKKSIRKSIPSIMEIKERYPLDEDPFYEISTDFPDILETARNEAARLLRTNLHYKLDTDVLEEHNDKLEFLVHQGTLRTHGFITKISRELTRLAKESEKLFLDLVFKANEYDIPLVGISRISHDRIIQKALKEVFGIKTTDTNDLNFLMGILENGDATCLIHRPIEKGRMKINNWYEFYFKRHPNVFKVEFISNHPEQDYKRILDILYTNTIPQPTRDTDPGPGVISGADETCFRYNATLSESILNMLRGSFRASLKSILG